MKQEAQNTEHFIHICENGIYIVWKVDRHQVLKLLHFSSLPFHPTDIKAASDAGGFDMVGINLAGWDRPYERHGNKYIVTAPGYRMKYVRHQDLHTEEGRRLVFTLRDEETELYVDTIWQFYEGLPVVRIWNSVRNQGQTTETLDYISTFHYEGIEKEGMLSQNEKMRIWIPHNSWQRELNWKIHTLPELGMEQVQPDREKRSSGMLRISNTGNWSAKEYLPMAYLENTETHSGLFWQIEHNGSWHWEIGDQNGHLYLAVGGPNEIYSHWFKNLAPGESFETVPAAIGVTKEGFDDAMGSLTSYRRRIRRKNRDNQELPIIFNDYMNCLWGKPTEEEEYPLIDAAAEVGCEYFCIDAGWYADGDWWDNVGEWKESRERFPGGLRKVTDYIRKKGMTAGLWLEPEVMGIHCALAREVPDDWFFMRHGKRVYDRSRYQLDYRNPQVRQHMHRVIDRIVSEYGAGYLKMDYNIEPGIGTELYADSMGEGMLEHERSFLSWLSEVWERHPELVIENCSSGGLRMDYAMLSRCSIQSTSDQDNYLMYASIAANAPTGVAPEQAAVWSYPMNHEEETDEHSLCEETVFNLVSAMLLRIHQSGHLARLDEKKKALVKEGISVYKSIRKDICKGLPFWPIGLSSYYDAWSAMGLAAGDTLYLAVWRRSGGEKQCELPINQLAGSLAEVEILYPSFARERFEWKAEEGILCVELARENTARLFRLRKKKSFTKVCLASADTEEQISGVLELYLKAFPKEERKPFSLILAKREEGVCEILCAEAPSGEMLGEAILLHYKDIVLLDYFAVAPKLRGRGIGSCILRQLQERYSGKRLLLEIENPQKPSDNHEQRLKRKHFYMQNNMKCMDYLVSVFDVEMEVLCFDCEVSFEDYRSVYEQVFGKRAAERIQLLRQ